MSANQQTGENDAGGKTLPRLLYFNGPWDYLGERMRRSFIEPFQALLEMDFNVISVAGDCDFRAEVEKHSPDMVLFHTGCEAPQEPEVTISNTDAYPEIPRAGFIYRDPFSPSRMMAMNRLRTWKVHQVFTVCRASDMPIKYFADSIYVPWWIDDRVVRDYGEAKDLPVTLTGSGWLNRCIYTWRNEIFCEVVRRFPVFHAPSLGNRQTAHDYVGEEYARLLNRSQFSAGCGTVSRYLTLKLLEIPGSRCCLIAEEIEVLKALGFRDGVNCVFANAGDVVGKIEALLKSPDRLREITDAGFRLVHDFHTARNRRMFAEWYELWRNRAEGERIVQVSPLEPLRKIPAGEPAPVVSFPAENPITSALVEGYRLWRERRWNDALLKFEWVLGIIPCVAEARVGAALCYLQLGRAPEATRHLRYGLMLMTQHFAYKHPDPIEQAFIAILCIRMKDAASAIRTLSSYETVRHPALNVIRWKFAMSNPELRVKPAFDNTQGLEAQNVETVHLFEQRTSSEWATLFGEYLR